MNFKFHISILLLFFLNLLNGQDAASLNKSGFEKIQSADFVGAEKDFTEAIVLNEKLEKEYLVKMSNYATMNAFEKAISDMPDGFIYNHEFAIPHYGNGLALEKQSKNEMALASYEKAVLIDPQYSDAFYQYGLALFAKGQKDKGCVNLQKAKTLGNENAIAFYEKYNCKEMGEAFLNSGNLKLEQKDYKGAIDDFTNGIKLNDNVTDLYLKRAACYTAIEENNKAINDYNKAIKSAPDSLEIIVLRGTVFNKMQNFQLAFDDFSTVIKVNPNIYESYMQRAFACEGMQNFSSAEYDYTQAIRLEPKNPIPYFKRGLITQDKRINTSCKDFKMAAAFGYEDAKIYADGCGKKD